MKLEVHKLGYIELQNNYKRIWNSLASSFVDSGAGNVLSILCFCPLILNSKNKFIIAKLQYGCGA